MASPREKPLSSPMKGEEESTQNTESTTSLKKGLKRISNIVSDKSAGLESFIEIARKSGKCTQSYLLAIESDTETFSRAVQKHSKNFSMQINWLSGRDFIRFTSNFASTIQEFAAKSYEITRINAIGLSANFNELTEALNSAKKQVSEKSNSKAKLLISQGEKFLKQHSKYSKACKEVSSLISEQKNAQADIRLYYNVAFIAKQDLKIKEAVKEVEIQEQKLQAIIVEGNQTIDELPVSISDAYKHVKDTFKNTLQRIIDSVLPVLGQNDNLISIVNNLIAEKNLVQDLGNLEENDQKIIQERLLMKNSDTIPPGVNFIPIQSALQRKDEISDQQERQYPESAQQYLETFEQLQVERTGLLKNLKDFLLEMSENYAALYSALESQAKDAKKVIAANFAAGRNDTVTEIVHVVIRDFIEWNTSLAEHLKLAFQHLKSTSKTVQNSIADQQSQTSGLFNMIKKLFNDLPKATNRKKWVIETSNILGVSLDSFKVQQDKRMKVIVEQIQKIIIEIQKQLEQQSKKAREYAKELTARRAHLEDDVEQVFSQSNPHYQMKSLIHPSEAISFSYSILFRMSTELQASLDKISQKQQEYFASAESTENSQKVADESNSASGKKEVRKFSVLFGVGENDLPIESYNCAFADKILLQGKMHIFSDRIGFHSYFNCQSFVGDTILCVPYSEILRMDKRKNALIFDNSIAVITPRGELFFTSYVQRDNCLKLLTFLTASAKESRSGSGRSSTDTENLTSTTESVDQIPERGISASEEEAIVHVPVVEEIINDDFKENRPQLETVVIASAQVSISSSVESQSVSAVGDIEIEQTSSRPQTLTVLSERNSSSVSQEAQLSKEILPLDNYKEERAQSLPIQKIEPLQKSVPVQRSVSVQQIPTEIAINSIEERKSLWKKESFFQKTVKTQDFELIIPDVSTREVFYVIFSHAPYTHPVTGAQYAHFMQYYMSVCLKETQLELGKFNPEPPQWYSSMNCSDVSSIETSPKVSQYEYKLVHPIKDKKAFGPSVSHCHNKEKYYWISASEFIMEREMFLSKIPYADSFTVRFCFQVTEHKASAPDSKIYSKLLIKFYVNFMKSTMFKGMIESGSQTENNDTIKNQFQPETLKALSAYRKSHPIITVDSAADVVDQSKSDEFELNIVELEFEPAQQQLRQPIERESRKESIQCEDLKQSENKSESAPSPKSSQSIALQPVAQQPTVSRDPIVLPPAQPLPYVYAEARTKKYKTQSLFWRGEKTTDFNLELSSTQISPREVFALIFSDARKYAAPSGKQYNHFMQYMTEDLQKDTDVVFGKFSPAPPQCYTDLSCDDYSTLENFEDYSLREIKLVHPVKEKIPFGPKVSHCDIKEKYFWISPEEFYMEKEVHVSKIPYAEYFSVRFVYHVHRDHLKTNATTQIDHKMYVNFVKSTAFKGKIENGSLTENTFVWKSLLSPNIAQIANNYLSSPEFAERSKKQAEKKAQLQQQPQAQQLVLDSTSSLNQDISSEANLLHSSAPSINSQESSNQQAQDVCDLSASQGIRDRRMAIGRAEQGMVPSTRPKSPTRILEEQFSKLAELHKEQEERLKTISKALTDTQQVVEAQQKQFQMITYVMMAILLFNFIRIFV